MGICANGFRDNCGVFRMFGATASNNAYPSAHHGQYARTGAMRNLTAGEGITNETVGVPQGNRHPAAWIMPQKPGALSARMLSEGEIAANAWAVKLAEAAMSGTGGMTGIGGLIVQLLADLSGSGEITDADLKAFLAAVAALTGTGGASATASGLGALLADLEALGGMDATPSGTGELTADVVVTGTGLTTANVGQAVWEKLVAAGFTAEDVLRLIASATSGKSAKADLGGGSVEITYRNLEDTGDAIVAEVNATGERVTVTRDAG